MKTKTGVNALRAWIEPIFPPQKGRGRRRTVSLRRVIDALMYQDRTGCQWRLIPLDFPPSGTVRYYFDKSSSAASRSKPPKPVVNVVVRAANIQDRDSVQDALTETQELCPSMTCAWADQSYRGDLIEWAAKVLGITIEIVTRGAEQVGFQVQPRRWVVGRTIA